MNCSTTNLPRARRGYAMLAALVFLAVGLIFIAIHQRHIATLLRVEQAREQVTRFEEGPVTVTARALQLLETGLPPSNPYTCGLTVVTSDGPQSFAVVFSSSGGQSWSVAVTPTNYVGGVTPMPDCFAQ